MSDGDGKENRREQLKLLHQTARGTLMGTLLRKFWHPVALSRDVAAGAARPLRIMGEELTLYRGESGRAYVVGGRCLHRLSLLHTGWVQGETVRCIYHGWTYDGTGRCVERPAEKDAGAPRQRIAGYPVREYGGLVFAYMGEEPVPGFELPRKDVFESAERVVLARAETWRCNWLQQVENSLDAAHVSFVHHMGAVGPFGAAVTASIPELSYAETEAGIEQVAVRGKGNVRKSDWTFPNNNHIVAPGLAKDDRWVDIGIWMTPNDDEHTTRFIIYCAPLTGGDARRFEKYFEDFGDYSPADHHDELFSGKYPDDPYIQLPSAQDYVATLGQGTIAPRTDEMLGRSDLGIAILRGIFLRELEALRAGRPIKPWRRRAAAAQMPTQPGPAVLADQT
jgi:5,5'-dehydrodivanillate O-demethylase